MLQILYAAVTDRVREHSVLCCSVLCFSDSQWTPGLQV